MTSQQPPQELQTIRQGIDEIDQELVALLARRFALTQEVGLLKASQSLQAVDAGREAEKIAAIRQLCEEQGLSPDLGADLLSRIMAEAARNHRQLRGQ